MKLQYIAAALMTMLFNSVVRAQMVRGVVEEAGTHIKLRDVFVRDANNRQLTLTDSKGRFEVKAETGNVLIFASPGYVSDTLYVTDYKEKRIQLETQSIALREVTVSASSAFNPRVEYPEVYERSKFYALSPTSWFGKEARDARRLKRYFAVEEEQRKVDSAFSRVYVSSIVPLRGEQLEDFMTLYRPSYEFLRSNNGPSLAAYINDCYKKYMALPADKRRVARLPGQSPTSQQR